MTDLVKRLESLSPKRLALVALQLEEKLDAATRQRNEQVAVVGIGCRIPGGPVSALEYWSMLDAGRDAVSETPPDRWKNDEYYDPDPDAPGRIATRWGGFVRGVDQFDAPFFGISRREAMSMDPQQRMLLEVCWEALEHAGQSPQKLSGSAAGVFVGLSAADYYHLLTSRGPEQIDAYLASGTAHSIAAGRIAYTLGLHGPNFPVDTACSSSLVAVHLAIQSLRTGECNLALAGGVNLILAPEVSIALSRSHMMAADGRCKVFDERADGFVRGEGCGVIVLKRLSDALSSNDNILAVLRGSAINQDGRSSGITAPNGPAQEAVIRQALANSGVDALEVSYIEAHGTGTSLGDPIEAHALAAVYGPGRQPENPLVVGSVKSNIGHIEAAAGIAGLIKVVLSLGHERIPPHLHFVRMNPHIDWRGMPVEIPSAGRAWPKGEHPRRAGVSSFGFSGTNAHVIVEEAPAVPAQTAHARALEVLTISARSDRALSELEQRYREWLPASAADTSDLCYTANTGRAQFPDRAAYLLKGRELPAEAFARGHSERAPEVVFLFTGQGAQYAGMGRELYETEPVFRAAMERCVRAVEGKLEPGLLEVIYGSATGRLNQTWYTQPATFAIEYALAQLWRSWGVEPAMVLGHSVGEYAAACVAGLYSVEAGMELIAERGRLSRSLEEGHGSMAAVLASKERVERACARQQGRVEVAADNGPESVVISGHAGSVEAVARELEGEGIRVERLRVSHGFHSPEMEPVEEEFEAAAGRVRYGTPQVEMVSTVTGGVVTGEAMGRPEYWRRQLRQRVEFTGAMGAVAARGARVFVEIGPGSTLLGMGQELMGAEGQVWAPSIRRSRADGEQMAESAALLWTQGVEVNWEQREAGRVHRRVPLPTYPFQRQRYWIDDARPAAITRLTCAAVSRVSGDRTSAAIPIYETVLDVEALPYIHDHCVGGVPVLPAAGYAALASAAAADALGLSQVSIRAFELCHTMRFEPEDAGRIVQTVLIPDRSGNAAFQILSRPYAAGSGGPWVLHATGTIQAAANASRQNVAELRARINNAADPEQFYRLLATRGIQIGPACRGLHKLWSGVGEALAEVSLNSEEHSGLDPALLDSCFQALGAAAIYQRGEADHTAHLLTRIGTLQLLAPLQKCAVVHARITGTGPEGVGLSGEFRVFDETGRLLATADDLLMLPVLREAAPVAPDDWFYSLDWLERPLAMSSANHSLGSILGTEPATQLTQALTDFAAANELANYTPVLKRLDALISIHVAVALRELGFDLTPGTLLDPEELSRRAGVLQRFSRLLDRLLTILVEDKVLARQDGLYTVLRTPNFDGADAQLSRLQRESPAFYAELELTQQCASRLAAVLRGKTDPLQLLSSGGTFQLLEQVYSESRAARTFNLGARLAVERALAGLSAGERISALEIGAGLGGTTMPVVQALAGRCAEYWYTDITPAFLERARRRLSGFDFVQYGVLDIERDPAQQGFSAATFDLVIAANVLHATPDLRSAIANATRLLRPGGMLLLIEGTRPERWVDVTFGMTEGWWKFADPELRAHYPLVAAEVWLRLLADAGIENATALQPEGGSQQVILLARAGAPPKQPAGRWVVVSPSPTRLEEALVQELARLARSAVVVNNVSDAGAALQDGECESVLLLSLQESASERSYTLFLELTRAVLQHCGRRTRLFVATAGAQPAGDCEPDPGQAVLWGLGRVAALEHPEIWGGMIDCDPRQTGLEQASLLIVQLLRGGNEDQVAYRGGRRYVPRLSPATPPRLTGISIRPESVYLVTGGLGGLGLKIAAWLAQNGARELILMGRSGLPDPSTWGELPADHPQASTCRDVAALRNRGVKVHVLAADIATAEGIETTRAALAGRSLAGIVHAAAVFDTTPLAELSAEKLLSVLHPKVQGTRSLEALSRDADFVVLFSSTTSLIGVRGMGAYAGANQFLDSYAHAARRRGLPVVSANWGTWDEMGSTDLATRESYWKAGLRPMDSVRALDALHRVLGGPAQAVVADVDWATLKALYEARRPRPILETVLAAAAANAASATQFESGGIAVQFARLPESERPDFLISVARGEAARVLALEAGEVDVNQGLFELGMDSLMSVELKRRLEKRCGLSLPSTLTFNYPNVRALASHLSERFAPVILPAEPALRPTLEHDKRDDLSEDELAALLAKSLARET